MKTCHRCQAQIADEAEICSCGVRLRVGHCNGAEKVSTTTRKLPKCWSWWEHALLMLVVAPICFGAAMIILKKAFFPVSLELFVFQYAGFFGASLIAIILSWLTLFFKKAEGSWIFLFVAVGLSAWVYPADFRAGVAQSASARITSQYVESNNIVKKTPSKDVLDRMVKEVIEEVAKQVPMVIDSHTTLASVGYINESVYFLYQFHSLEAKNIDKELFTKKMAEFSRNNFCTDPNTKLFRTSAREIVVNWKYVDVKGIVISNLSMKGAECG